jgi:hypothetical protein
MSPTRFQDFSLVFNLPQTKNKKLVRQSMFDYVKDFLYSIELVQKSKVKMRKAYAIIEQEHFGVFIDARENFYLGCTFDRKKTVDLTNAVMNEICRRLNEKDWKEKSKILVYSFIDSILDSSHDPFLALIGKDTWEKLFKGEENYRPRRIEIWQPPNGDELRKGVNIISRRKGNMIECIQSNVYRDSFPINVVSKTMSELEETKKTLLTKLIGEG